jgi:hypothetical protein
MTTFFRTTIIILVLATPLTLWAIGLHFARIPSSVQEAARRRGEEVERLEQALKRREEARHQAVQELLCQHRTLTQTLQRFQELNQEWPDLSALARIAGAKESDEEIAYRLIIWYVQMTLTGQAEELAAVLQRLEKEYRQSQAGRKTEYIAGADAKIDW